VTAQAIDHVTGLVVGGAMLAALGAVLGLVAGFALRDFLERRICGWVPGADDE
jgi:uncharacterized membrane protein (Fun14 family)